MLAGKVAVITGAARGIGRAAALEFAAQGASLVLGDRRDTVAETADLVVASGGRATWQVLDVTDSDAVRSLIETATGRYGTLDVLFNNAGVTGAPSSIIDQDEDAFDRVLAVNVRGVFLGMKHALPVMIARRSGSIINTSSVTAVKAVTNLAPYAASKHAVVGLTRVAAMEAGPHGVRVNAIMPGPTATPMIGDATFSGQVPLGRLSDASEQATVACFLASGGSSFINGETILVDGGMAYSGNGTPF